MRTDDKPEQLRLDTPRLLLSSIALNLLTFALPIMTLQIYDRILPNPDSGTLPVLMAGVAAAVALEAALRLARAWMIGWNGAVYEQRTAGAAMRHLMAADPGSTAGLGTGEFLNRMAAIGKMKDFHNGYSISTIVDLAFIPVFLGVIFYIARPLALILVFMLLIFALVSVRQGCRLRGALERRDAVDDRRYDFMIECLKGIHTIKSFSLENLFARRYDLLQERSGIASLRAAEASTAAFNAGTLLSHLMMAMVITAGAVFAIKGLVTAGALVATLQLSGRLMQPVQRGLVLLAKYEDFLVARKKLDTIFSLPLAAVSPAPEMPDRFGTLSVRHVSSGTLLKDINLDLEIGDVVVIGGIDAAAKTELMEILAGLRPAEAGDVLVDGLDIHAYPPQNLVAHVGYLPPEGALFRGTIRDNITGFGSLQTASAQELSHLLGVDTDVARLPAGFDTMLQADGADPVTPGLRQRIALSRILAARPRVILFDEADRGLDRIGYDALFRLLARLARKTAMVIISDDANMVSLATRRYTLRGGQLVEEAREAIS